MWRFAIVVLAVCGWSAAASAQSHVVDVATAGDAPTLTILEADLSALLEPLDVELRLRRVPIVDARAVIEPPDDPPPALARVWIELSDDEAVVFLADAPWERVLVRRVPTPEGPDVVAREQVAQIVFTAVEALLGGATIGLTRNEARESMGLPTPEPDPEPEPEPAPAPQAPSPIAIDASLWYAARFWAPGPTVQHTPTIAAAVRVRSDGPAHPLVRVAVGLTIPFAVEANALELDIFGVDFRVDAGADLYLSPKLHIRALIGLLLEYARIEPEELVGGTGVSPGEPIDVITPLLSLSATVGYSLFPRLWVFVGTTLDVDLADTRFVIARGASAQTVFDPGTVQPSILVGAGGRL